MLATSPDKGIIPDGYFMLDLYSDASYQTIHSVFKHCNRALSLLGPAEY